MPTRLIEEKKNFRRDKTQRESFASVTIVSFRVTRQRKTRRHTWTGLSDKSILIHNLFPIVFINKSIWTTKILRAFLSKCQVWVIEDVFNWTKYTIYYELYFYTALTLGITLELYDIIMPAPCCYMLLLSSKWVLNYLLPMLCCIIDF